MDTTYTQFMTNGTLSGSETTHSRFSFFRHTIISYTPTISPLSVGFPLNSCKIPVWILLFIGQTAIHRYMRIKTVSTGHSYREIDRRCAMRIIVVGRGKVGSELAGQLSAVEHDLTLIDLSERRPMSFPTHTTLLSSKAAAVIAITFCVEAGVQDTDRSSPLPSTHDEINLLSCSIARKASGCRHCARVRDPEYVHSPGFIRDELVFLMVNPELSIKARVISRSIRFRRLSASASFARGRIELLDPQNSARVPPDGTAVCLGRSTCRSARTCCCAYLSAATVRPISRKGDSIPKMRTM